MSRRERVIELSAKIQALRGELAHLEVQLDYLLSHPEDEPGTGRAVIHFVGHGAADQSIARQIIALLDADPEKTFSVEEIVRKLGLGNSTSARSTLTRLVKIGDIIRPVSGRFQSAAKERAMDEASEDDEAEDVRAIATASLATAISSAKGTGIAWAAGVPAGVVLLDTCQGAAVPRYTNGGGVYNNGATPHGEEGGDD
jgi:hypothetical protein